MDRVEPRVDTSRRANVNANNNNKNRNKSKTGCQKEPALSACDLIRYCCPIAVARMYVDEPPSSPPTFLFLFLSFPFLTPSLSDSFSLSVLASARYVLPLARHYNMPFAIEFSSTAARTYSSCLQPICIFVCSILSVCIKVSSLARGVAQLHH